MTARLSHDSVSVTRQPVCHTTACLSQDSPSVTIHHVRHKKARLFEEQSIEGKRKIAKIWRPRLNRVTFELNALNRRPER